MNREIKFRIWNKKKQTWIHGPGEEVSLFGEMILLGGFLKGIPVSKINDCVALQYTGIKDINGVEIYDGDLVELHTASNDHVVIGLRNHYGLYEVYWDRYYRLKQILPNWFFKPSCVDTATTFTIMKVVGNIYSNPELLINQK